LRTDTRSQARTGSAFARTAGTGRRLSGALSMLCAGRPMSWVRSWVARKATYNALITLRRWRTHPPV
jgi:hypothetical protein